MLDPLAIITPSTALEPGQERDVREGEVLLGRVRRHPKGWYEAQLARNGEIYLAVGPYYSEATCEARVRR